MITPGAPHTTRKTAGTVTRRCGADHVLAGRGNAPETTGIPGAIDRERDATGGFAEDPARAHGRLERRSIRAMAPPKGLASHPGVRQAARVTRHREPLKRGPGDAGKDHTGTACPITSPGAGKASPEGPPTPDRGHWAAENLNHRQRDRAFGGDACLTRTGNGPANRASPSSIAPAVILPGRRVPAPPDSRRTSAGHPPDIATTNHPGPKTAPASAHACRTAPESVRNPAVQPSGQAEQKSVGKSWAAGRAIPRWIPSFPPDSGRFPVVRVRAHAGPDRHR